MIVVDPTLSDNTFKFIPRNYGVDSVVIRNEATQEDTTIPVVSVTNSYYDEVTITYTFTEGQFYYMKCYTAGELVYNDKIFATSQGVDYSINNGEYIEEDSQDNQFIVYE